MRFDAIGAPWAIDAPGGIPAVAADRVRALIERYDRAWSRFRDDSLVTRISRGPGSWRLPPEAAELFAVFGALYRLSGGAVSPLVGRSLEAIGYDAHYSLRESTERIPAPRWEDALSWDGERLDAPRPVLLDVGAAGKGQLVDLVDRSLADDGVEHATVDASGDLRHRGERPLRIALEDPRDQRHAIGVLHLDPGLAFCASAIDRRAWGDGLHHVLDATSGRPVTRYRASWVVSEQALVADGAATALLILDRDQSAGLSEALGTSVEWARMRADGRVERSSGFPAELFLRERTTGAAQPLGSEQT